MTLKMSNSQEMNTNTDEKVLIEEDDSTDTNSESIDRKIDLTVSTILFVKATVLEQPEAQTFLRAFESTSKKSRYQNKFNDIFDKVKLKAHELNKDEFYDYFIKQQFKIVQNDKKIVLKGNSEQWRYMLFVWLIANDPSLTKKFILKKPDEDRSQSNPYHGLPFTRKQIKHIIRNFNQIPKHLLEDMRKKMKNIPSEMLPDDLCRELHHKLTNM